MGRAYTLAVIGCLSMLPAMVPLAGTPALAAPALTTTIGVATFDASRTAIAIPYEGPAPRVETFKLSDTHYYLELTPARLARGGVQHHLIGDTIVRYTMANRPTYPAVRISFVLLKPGAPTFRVDAQHRRVVILPLGREAVTHAPGHKAPAAAVAAAPVRPRPTPTPSPAAPALPVAATPAPSPTPSVKVVLPHKLTPPSKANMLRTEIGRPYLDDFHHRLVVPFTGPAPSYAVKVYPKNPRWVYLDFDQAAIAIDEPRFDSFSDPAFDGWMLTEHAGKPRLYLKFKVQAPVTAQVYPESGEMWFILPPRPADDHASE